MKVAVLGATGKAGSAIMKEAKARGLEVTAIARHADKVTEEVPVIEKSVYELTAEDIKEFDVLASALGFWQHFDEFVTSMNHLIGILQGQKTRLFVVGGAGSLFVDAAHTMQLKDTPNFSKEYKPLSDAMSQGLDVLKQTTDVHWTYISPAIFFDATGARTGDYTFGGEELVTDAEGKSYISYADYAIAFVDEIVANNYPNQRISVYHP